MSPETPERRDSLPLSVAERIDEVCTRFADVQRIVSGSDDQTVKVRDAHTGQETRAPDSE